MHCFIVVRCRHEVSASKGGGQKVTTAMHAGGRRGNLIVRLKVKGHPKLQRIGSTISSCINIPWAYLPARQGITRCHCCVIMWKQDTSSLYDIGCAQFMSGTHATFADLHVLCLLFSTYTSLAKIELGLSPVDTSCWPRFCLLT